MTNMIENEDRSLLWCDITSIVNWLPMCWRSLLTQCSG